MINQLGIVLMTVLLNCILIKIYKTNKLHQQKHVYSEIIKRHFFFVQFVSFCLLSIISNLLQYHPDRALHWEVLGYHNLHTPAQCSDFLEPPITLWWVFHQAFEGSFYAVYQSLETVRMHQDLYLEQNIILAQFWYII